MYRVVVGEENMNDLREREMKFDEWCAFANKAMHQIGLLVMMVVGITVVIVSTTAVSALGVVALWQRLKQ
jgi:TRAP-type C4-dicarboxylate transport system permease large subunit